MPKSTQQMKGREGWESRDFHASHLGGAWVSTEAPFLACARQGSRASCDTGLSCDGAKRQFDWLTIKTLYLAPPSPGLLGPSSRGYSEALHYLPTPRLNFPLPAHAKGAVGHAPSGRRPESRSPCTRSRSLPGGLGKGMGKQWLLVEESGLLMRDSRACPSPGAGPALRVRGA